MKTLLTQLRWQFVILRKNNLIAISVAVTFMYALIFYFIKDLPNTDRFLTLLIYNDPAIIGLFFVGLSIIMEKNQSVLQALFVTPINHHVYLITKILALSIIGWACASGMALAMLGMDVIWLDFSLGVFGTCLIFSLAGIFVVSYTTEFLHFMLRSIPVMFLLSLPLLNYFGLTNTAIFEYMPIHGSLNLISRSFGETAANHSVFFDYGITLFWILLLYSGVFMVFRKRVIKSPVI